MACVVPNASNISLKVGVCCFDKAPYPKRWLNIKVLLASSAGYGPNAAMSSEKRPKG